VKNEWNGRRRASLWRMKDGDLDAADGDENEYEEENGDEYAADEETVDVAVAGDGGAYDYVDGGAEE